MTAVRQLVGRLAGQIVDLPHAAAVRCVEAGSACWPGDEPRVRGLAMPSPEDIPGAVGLRPDNAAPGEQVSGETADGEALAPTAEAQAKDHGTYTIKHVGRGRWVVVDPDGVAGDEKLDKADAQAMADELNG